MPNHKLPITNPWLRITIMVGAGLALWLASFGIQAYSERINAMLVPLWVLHFVLAGKKLGKNAVVGIIGVGIGLLATNIMGTLQAAQLGAKIAWFEPFQKVYFTAGIFVVYNVLSAILTGLFGFLPRAKELLSSPRGWWLRTLRAGLAICLIAPYVYVSFNIHRFKYASVATPLSEFKLPFQVVDFAAKDGAELKGWYIPKSGSSKTIVVVHGIGSNRGDALSVAPFLHKGGFNVFLFDLRGHGESSGHTTTFGVNEGRDVEAAVSWVRAQKPQDSIGILGYSMGGSSIMHALGNSGLPEVKAVVMDSTFAEFEPLAREQSNFMPSALANPFLSVLSFYTKLEIGYGLSDIRPGQYIHKISPRPLLLIHGTGDTLIPITQARTNFKWAKEPKSLYIVPDAQHCAARLKDQKGYESRVLAFFRKSLK